MNTDKKNDDGKTSSEDNLNNNAHYSKDGEITREDDRDKHPDAFDWDAEKSRTSRNK